MTRASLDEMQRPQRRAAPIFGRSGSRGAIDDATGVRLVHHGGGTNGQVAHLRSLPRARTALAVLTNHQGGGEVVGAALDSRVEGARRAQPERSRSCSTRPSTSARTGRRCSTPS